MDEMHLESADAFMPRLIAIVESDRTENERIETRSCPLMPSARVTMFLGSFAIKVSRAFSVDWYSG